MTIREFLKETYPCTWLLRPRPYVLCMDGFKVSVQGGTGYASVPDTPSMVYQMLELGFPNEEEPELMPYAEDPEIPTGTVYTYVPIDVVEKVVSKHGGIRALEG